MLELSLTTIILEIVNFLVLAVLLYQLVFKRVVRNVEKRAAEKERMLKDLIAERDKTGQLREELEAQLAKVDEEVAEIVEQAQAQIDREREVMLKAARSDAEHIVKEARTEADHIQLQVMEEYRAALLDVIVRISGQAIGRTAAPEIHDTMVQELSDQIWEWGRKDVRQLQSLRRSLEERKPSVHIATARELTPDQQRLLVRTFNALADKHVDLEIVLQPDLVMGLKAHIGDIVIENSVSGKLSELREEVDQSLKEQMLNE